MKKLLFILLVSNLAFTQTIWNGPTMTFTKVDYADPNQEANQDQITSNVWLTRGNNGQLYNAKTESDSSKSSSPDDTEWAFGTTSNLSSLTFSTFRGTSKPQNAVGLDMVLHLITDNIYIDIKITSWTSGQGSGGNGGGFSYERSTDPSLGIQDNNKSILSVYPNPSTSFLRVSGLNASTNYRLYNILGAEVQSGTLKPNQAIDIDALQSGVYMLQISNTALPFVKN